MYPPPYTPPQMPYYAAPVDPLAPAKRASLMMFIVGPLIVLMGGCMLSMPPILRISPSPEVEQMRRQVEQELHAPLETVFTRYGAVMVVLGLVILTLAFFVRRAGRTSTVISCVLIGLLGLYSVLNVAGSLLMGNIAGACMSVLMVALFGLMLVWLIQAAIAAGNVHLAQQQYAAQYWQYQQTMQAYANSGYGYGYPSQAPPPAAPQPPPAQPPSDAQPPPPPT